MISTKATMTKFNFKTLVEKTVRAELKSLLEQSKNTTPAREWKEGYRISPKTLNLAFKTFHFSNKDLGEVGKFTPRVPLDPWINQEDHIIEDDFTPRVSLGPTIQKALEAIGGEQRTYLYAGDVRKDPSDDFETVETDEKIKTCPSSDANDYGPHFSISSWIDELYDEELIDGETTEDIMDLMDDSSPGEFGPKDLPGSLGDDFMGCVPDATDTKELWSLKPVKLFLVALNQGSHLELTAKGAEILNRLMERLRKDAKQGR